MKKTLFFLFFYLLVYQVVSAQITLTGSPYTLATGGYSCSGGTPISVNGTYSSQGASNLYNGKEQFSKYACNFSGDCFVSYNNTCGAGGTLIMRWTGSIWEFVLKIQVGPNTFNFVFIDSVSGNTNTPPCGPAFGGNISGDACSQNCTASMIVTGSTTICAGQLATLTATGCSGSVTWDNGGGTGASVSVSPMITTTYTATCSTAGICTGTATVTVNPLPTAPTISLANGNVASLCSGQTTTLNAMDCTGTVTWSPGGTAGTTLSVSTASSYTATCTNANNCSSIPSNSISISVTSPPTITSPATTNLCTSNPITLAATGTTFQWQRNGTDIVGATSSTYNATQVGSYQVFTTGSGYWTAQTSGTTQNLNGVYFMDSQNGWVVGNSGTILHTTDGGNTWTAQSSGTTNTLNSIWLTSLTDGVAVGAGGTILRTTNGGTTWTALTSGTTATLRDISFGSATTGLIVGVENAQFGNGVMLRTTDGGSSWASISTANSSGQGFASVSMSDANNAVALWTGVASGSRTFKSTDGGATWISAQNLYGFEPWTDMQMANSTIGYTIGGAGKVAKTNNGGSTWTDILSGFPAVVVNNSYAFQFNGVAFPSSTVGWVVGGAFFPSTSTAYAYNTTDGGVTWSAQTLPSGTLSLYKTHFPNIDYGWAVGAGGTIVKYTTRLCGSNVVTLTAGTASLNLSGSATNGTQVATQTIISTQTVAASINATYQAGQSITLSPTFNAQTGSTFLAKIQTGCN